MNKPSPQVASETPGAAALSLGKILAWGAMFMGGLCLTICLAICWSSKAAEEDIKLLNMWIRLAVNGFAEPMPAPVPHE